MKKQLLSLLVAFPLIANAQFFENFDASNNIPQGWTVINKGSNKTWGIVDFSSSPTASAFSGTKTVSIGFDNTQHNDYLITPAITVTAGSTDFFSFYARSRDPLYPEKVALKVSTTTPTDDAFTSVLDAEIAPNSGANFYRFEYDLSSYVGQTIYIAFHSTTLDQFYFDIDDVLSSAKPNCDTPLNITYSNITSTSATLSWDSSTGVTGYTVEYGPAGFTSGTGTTIDVTNPTAIISVLPNTKYDAYVRSKCSTINSNWSNPVTFTSACSINNTFPMIENFDNNTIPNCWSNENLLGGGTAVWTYVINNGNGTISPKSPAFMAEFRTPNVGNQSKLVTGIQDLTTITNPAIKFSYANVNWFDDVDELRVYYRATATDSWTQVGPEYITEKTSWTDVILPLPNKSATYQIAFEGRSNWARGINLDDVSIGEMSTLAINDIKKASVSVYPNPVRDVLNINANAEILAVELYSMTGQLVKVLDKKAKQVNLSDLTKGAYILRVKSAGKYESYKIIKD